MPVQPVPKTPTVRLERTLDCTPDDVYAAFTRPEALAKWISPFPGIDAEIHELDARVGGRIRFTMVDAQGNRYVEDEGVFEVLTPTEIVQYQPNETRSDIFRGYPQRIRATFEPVGKQTRLVIEVYGLPPQVPADAAAQGFGACLDKLAALVQAKRAAKALRLERTFHATPRELWAAWTDPKLYAKWLNPTPADLVIHEWDLRVGGRVRFDMPLPDGKVNHEEGVFHVLSPYTHLVTGSADKSFLLDVVFEPVDASRTRLVVTATGVPPEFHEPATVGWGQCFDKLAGVLKAVA